MLIYMYACNCRCCQTRRNISSKTIRSKCFVKMKSYVILRSGHKYFICMISTHRHWTARDFYRVILIKGLGFQVSSERPTTLSKLQSAACLAWGQWLQISQIRFVATRVRTSDLLSEKTEIKVVVFLSSCKVLIYRVAVNTKFTSCHVVNFCIYYHPINLKFTIWHFDCINKLERL